MMNVLRSATRTAHVAVRSHNAARTVARAYSGRPEPCQVENMTQIGTRRVFTEEHDLFRETVRRFYEEEVMPYVVNPTCMASGVHSVWLTPMLLAVTMTSGRSKATARKSCGGRQVTMACCAQPCRRSTVVQAVTSCTQPVRLPRHVSSGCSSGCADAWPSCA